MKQTPKTIARAFVKETAKQAETLDRTLDELRRFEAVARPSGLLKWLGNPFLPAADKRAMLTRVLPELGLSAETEALLVATALEGQMKQFGRLVSALEELRLRQFNREEATAITVKPLAAADKKRLQSLLEKKTGHDILLREKTNPSILGGVVVKLQDTLIDASVLRKIKNLKKMLNV